MTHKNQLIAFVVATIATSGCANAQLSQDDFRACLNELRVKAVKEGVSYDTFESLTANIDPVPSVLKRLDAQPEVKLTTQQYLDKLLTPERIEQGQQAMASNARVLESVSMSYSIPASTIAAVWGVESRYGTRTGSQDIIRSLGTLSCSGRRQPFFRKELISAMRIVERGDLKPEQLKGSWAGAFGQTQFMPSTYERLAVDFDGNGQKDLVSSTADALGSAANFLKKAGWISNQVWGLEVSVPEQAMAYAASRKDKRSAQFWIEQGIKAIDGSQLNPFMANSALIAPDGAQGRKFLVTKNFDAIFRYNASISYALAIALLSDKLSYSTHPVQAQQETQPNESAQ